MARPIQLPTNKTSINLPIVLSKRVAPTRASYQNRRKLQAIPGQIVYVPYGQQIIPMRVLCIDDCAVWSKNATWKNRREFYIYYDLQPLKKTATGWRAIPYYPYRSIRNNKINAGWIGHAVNMDDFCLTSAEANWRRLSG